MKREELNKLNIKDLNQEVMQFKKELFNLKLSAASGEVKDYSQFKKLRANIARCLTMLNQKKNA